MAHHTHLSLCLAIFCSMLAAAPLVAAPPDLTAGGVPDENPLITFNMGPTGARGWAYHDRVDTSESRQILVTSVEYGSPSYGILTADDVVLGADGTGAEPALFAADARKSLGLAIGDAEARSPAELKLLFWRAGVTNTVTLTLQTMGAYAPTAPYNCPKSAKILEEGLDYVYNNESSGRYSFGAITLLATNNPTYRARAQSEARALIPSQATMDEMMSDAREDGDRATWQRGHTLIFLSEYYLATGDTNVLPAIEAYAVNIAKNTSMYGTVGHIFADHFPDGSLNGPMGGYYGVVNTPGLFCLLGIQLAKECGLTNPEIEPAIERASKFFAYYAGKGAIPYGEHTPFDVQHENNGKCGLSALTFVLQTNRLEQAHFFAKMCAASGDEYELGHTGSYFNYMWAPLGAAVGGEEAVASLFAEIQWRFDLSRCWNGRFQYDNLSGEGPNSGSSYNGFPMSAAALLTYALPLRQLHITGKGHATNQWLSVSEVADTVTANTYDATGRSIPELIGDIESWSPKVRKQAGEELRTRSPSQGDVDQITSLATNVLAASGARGGACYALGQISNSGPSATLASLLVDGDSYVRYMAAESMRYRSRTENLLYKDTVLAAAASTGAPLFPIRDEDPLQLAHGRIAMLLFYSWNAFGPRGILWDSVAGVDRGLLYPAIRAIGLNPNGLSRGTLERTYDNLDYADVLEVAGTIVDSIIYRASADKMFSEGCRRGGVAALKKWGIAEGVPGAMIYAADELGGRRMTPLELLGQFGSGVHSVEPDPDALGFLASYTNDDEVAVADIATASYNQIIADTNNTALLAFKAIDSATADDAVLTLPANSTTLRVSAHDYAEGDSIFSWQKLSGPGVVSFSRNGTRSAATNQIQFTGGAGTYELKVTMSDSRGLTEAYETVTVQVLEPSGNDLTPPDPDPMTWAVAPAAISETSITMTATNAVDASGVEYAFFCTAGAGHDSGWQDSPVYTDTGLVPGTEYSYAVAARDKSTNQNQTALSASVSAVTAGTAPTLKIFILAGQSNMEGHGEMNPLGTPGTLETTVASNATVYGYLKDGDDWAVRDDVWIWYKRGGTTLLKGGLSTGYGAYDHTIGPELMFGNVLDDNYNEPILIIKTAWGGKSLAVDFRPPSSGWTNGAPLVAGDQGFYYQEMLNYVGDVVTNLPSYFPDYNASNGYEIAGFGWHQGWNDRVNQAYNDEYETNMVNFINDVRADLGVPALPFVIATTGMSGWGETNVRALSLMAAQLAMENFTQYPAFEGNVAVVDTRDFWRDVAESPSSQSYHWNRNAATYLDIGEAMGKKMIQLVYGGDIMPPVPNPAQFTVLPTVIDLTTISMTATVGRDISGPVEYLFAETSGNAGGLSSGWQTNATYINSGLMGETRYTYRVSMRDSQGNETMASLPVSVSTGDLLPYPPTNLTATIAVGEVVLTWDASTDATAYVVKRSPASGGGFANLATVSTTNYTDSSVSFGANYYYAVSALNPIGEGADSDAIFVELPSLLPFSENFEARDPGALNGQNGWVATNATVQSTVAVVGQAAELSSDPASMQHRYTSEGTNVWSDFKLQPVFFPRDPYGFPDDATVILYFDASGHPVAYDGASKVVYDTVSVSSGAWVRVTTRCDYSSRTWDLYIDGAEVASSIGFYNAGVTQCEFLQVVAPGTTPSYLDDLLIDVMSPFLINQLPLIYWLSPSASLSVARGTNLVLSAISSDSDGSVSEVRFLHSATNLIDSSSVVPTSTVTWLDVPIGNTYDLLAVAVDDRGGMATSSVITVSIDSDFDGLPDQYEEDYGLSSTNANDRETSDVDSDGLSDYEEFIAGTLPSNALSVLRIASGVPTNGTQFAVSFETVLDRVYSVEYRDALQAGSWTNMQGNIPGTGESISVVDPEHVMPRFYRIRVERE